MTEITQADIDAASAVQWDAVVRVGSLAEAFARHRLAERAKIVAWLRQLAEEQGFLSVEDIESIEHETQEAGQ